MNAMHGTMLGLVVAMGGWVCSAQQASIPFGQLEGNGQLSASSFSTGVTPSEPFVTGFVRMPPVTVPRTLGSSYFLLNGVHLGTAVFDMEMTQHCIATHQCREGNPLMPSSLAGQLSVDFAGDRCGGSQRGRRNRTCAPVDFITCGHRQTWHVESYRAMEIRRPSIQLRIPAGVERAKEHSRVPSNTRPARENKNISSSRP